MLAWSSECFISLCNIFFSFSLIIHNLLFSLFFFCMRRPYSLGKPFERDELQQLIKQIFGDKDGSTQCPQ